MGIDSGDTTAMGLLWSGERGDREGLELVLEWCENPYIHRCMHTYVHT